MKTAYCNELNDTVDIKTLRELKYTLDNNYAFYCPNSNCNLELTLCAWNSTNKAPYFCRSNNNCPHRCNYDATNKTVLNYFKNGKHISVNMYDVIISKMTLEEFDSLDIAMYEKPITQEEQKPSHGIKVVNTTSTSSDTNPNSRKKRKPTFHQICNFINNKEEDCPFCIKLTKESLDKKSDAKKLVLWGEIKKIEEVPCSTKSMAYINIDIEDGFQYSFLIKNSTVEKKTELNEHGKFAIAKKVYLYYDNSYKLSTVEFNRYKIDKTDLRNLNINQYLHCI